MYAVRKEKFHNQKKKHYSLAIKTFISFFLNYVIGFYFDEIFEESSFYMYDDKKRREIFEISIKVKDFKLFF